MRPTWSLLLAAFGLLLTGGCAGLTESSWKSREQASRNAPEIAAEQVWQIKEATFILIASPTELGPSDYRLTDRGISARLADSARGLAFPIDRRGYFLTAQHCLGVYSYLVGPVDGKLQIVRAVPISAAWAQFGAEYALLKAPLALSRYLEFGATEPPGSPVCAPGLDRSGGLLVMQGTLLSIDSRRPEFSRGIAETSLPLRRGDSGGPLLNRRGEVIGINTGIEWRLDFRGFAVRRVSCIIDSSKIRLLVDQDIEANSVHRAGRNGEKGPNHSADRMPGANASRESDRH